MAYSKNVQKLFVNQLFFKQWEDTWSRLKDSNENKSDNVQFHYIALANQEFVTIFVYILLCYLQMYVLKHWILHLAVWCVTQFAVTQVRHFDNPCEIGS